MNNKFRRFLIIATDKITTNDFDGYGNIVASFHTEEFALSNRNISKSNAVWLRIFDCKEGKFIYEKSDHER